MAGTCTCSVYVIFLEKYKIRREKKQPERQIAGHLKKTTVKYKLVFSERLKHKNKLHSPNVQPPCSVYENKSVITFRDKFLEGLFHASDSYCVCWLDLAPHCPMARSDIGDGTSRIRLSTSHKRFRYFHLMTVKIETPDSQVRHGKWQQQL